jgi:NAD(P)-dependent dehydrogenase (short-subunit alcohol dehydrogenase family)
MDLSGRVAVVTGATGHLGSAISDVLAQMGASIAVVDLQEDACAAAAERVAEAHGVRSLARAVDLTDDERVRDIPASVGRELGSLDILVNCAAMVGTSERGGWVTPFSGQRADVWREALDVNLTAAFVLVQAAAELLAASGHGSVVNIASIYGVVGPDWGLYEGTPMGNPAGYAASKGGLLAFTRWLATTLGPRVRVNSVTPGGIFRETAEPFLSRYVARTPLARMAAEEDITGAVAYLASDLSAYVTGHNLVVDGGWTAW